MGILDRLRTNRPALAAPNTPESWRTQNAWCESWGSPRNLIAGESHRQAELRRLAKCKGRCLRLVDVVLAPEPENAYDSNAVAAWVDRVQIGFLRANVAAGLADVCHEFRIGVPTFAVAGVIRGGWDYHDAPGNIGVHVWLDRLITPGPAIELPDEDFCAVSWPPHPDEIEVLQR